MDEQEIYGRMYLVVNRDKPRPFILHVIDGDRRMAVELSAKTMLEILIGIDAALREYNDYWQDRMN